MRYVVSARGGASASVEAPNWLAALGVGLDELGNVGAIDRLACEVLMNGTVLARDARTGQGYVVRPLDVEAPADDPLEEESELVFGIGEELGEYDDDSEVVAPAVFMEPPSEDFLELPSAAMAPIPEPATDDLTSLDPVGALEEFDEHDDSGVFIDDDITDRFPSSEQHVMVVPGLTAVADAVATGPACEAALEALQGLVACESASVLLQEPDHSLRFAVVTGPNAEQLTGSVLPPDTGIAGFSLNRGTGLIVRRAASDPRFYGGVDRQTGYTTESVLCVPLIAGTTALGCIQLLNPPTGSRFESDDLRVAQDVAEALSARLVRERLG